MTFLPIVSRELRVASRRKANYWTRSAAALLVIVIGSWLFILMREQRPQEVSQYLFGVLTGISVIYCLMSGVRATSDCLSQEKREGTLGLLFLTDLKGYDVVLGKLAATSLSALYAVLAIVPMLAVPLLMGGLTLGEFGRMALVTLNTLFFSLSIGIFVSSLSRSARTAVGTTFLLIVLFAALFPAAGGISASLRRVPRFEPLFFLPSPGFSFFMAFDTNFKPQGLYFWWSIGVIHGLAWIFLVCSALIVPRSWQDKPAGLRKLRWRERWKNWSYGNSSERLAFRRRLLDRNAFYWLASRARLKPASVWLVLGLLGCVWVWGYVKFRRDWLTTPLYFTTGIILNVLLKGWVAGEAGRQIAEDRQRGALELLLSTPLTVKDILRGQRLALQRQFLGPMILILLIGLTFMVATGRETAMDEDRMLFILAWVAGMILLIADLVGLYWVGMWLAIISKNPSRAASANLARILVLPWIAIAAMAVLISLNLFRLAHEPGAHFFLGLWFLLGVAADVAFGSWARQKLLSEFRLAASQRFARRSGIFKRLLGKGGKTTQPSAVHENGPQA